MLSDKRIKKYFNIAKQVALESDYSHNKVGCVLIYKNKIISIGHNEKKSNTIQKYYNNYRSTKERTFNVDNHENYIHAEIQCVNNATRTFKGDLSKCQLFICRITKSGQIKLSKPCLACSKYLEDMGIKSIYYTTDNGWCYERRERDNEIVIQNFNYHFIWNEFIVYGIGIL